jgi:DNA-binding XRE family transcriptional regulator
MNSTQQNWNNRVEARRVALGLDKSELARLVGVKSPTLQNWIDGTIKELMVRNAIAVCRVLGVRMEWLLDGVGPMEASATDHLGLQQPPKPNGAELVVPVPGAETSAELAEIVKAALPVRQKAMETVCRFIIAADLAALPAIIAAGKEIATTGMIRREVISGEETALLAAFNNAGKDTKEAIMALLMLAQQKPSGTHVEPDVVP